MDNNVYLNKPHSHMSFNNTINTSERSISRYKQEREKYLNNQ